MHGDWLSLPFEAPIRTELKRKFGCFGLAEWPAIGREVPRVQGIPSLVVFDSAGNLITRSGKEDVLTLGIGALKQWISCI